MDWNNFKRRLLPGLALVVLFALLLSISSLLCFGRMLLCLASIGITAIAAFECAQALGASAPRQRVFFLLALLPGIAVWGSLFKSGICTPNIMFSGTMASFGVAGLFVIAALLAIGIALGLNQRERSQNWFSGMFPAILFLASGGGSLAVLCTYPDAQRVLSWVIITTAVNDIAAYVSGSLCGGSKMAVAISPSKTWTGSLGGLFFCVLAGALLSDLLPFSIGFFPAAFIALWTGIGGQFGDLLESYLKRSCGLKDFGSSLGSHGGVFDRVDSHFGAAMILLAILEALS